MKKVVRIGSYIILFIALFMVIGSVNADCEANRIMGCEGSVSVPSYTSRTFVSFYKSDGNPWRVNTNLYQNISGTYKGKPIKGDGYCVDPGTMAPGSLSYCVYQLKPDVESAHRLLAYAYQNGYPNTNEIMGYNLKNDKDAAAQATQLAARFLMYYYDEGIYMGPSNEGAYDEIYNHEAFAHTYWNIMHTNTYFDGFTFEGRDVYPNDPYLIFPTQPHMPNYSGDLELNNQVLRAAVALFRLGVGTALGPNGLWTEKIKVEKDGVMTSTPSGSNITYKIPIILKGIDPLYKGDVTKAYLKNLKGTLTGATSVQFYVRDGAKINPDDDLRRMSNSSGELKLDMVIEAPANAKSSKVSITVDSFHLKDANNLYMGRPANCEKGYQRLLMWTGPDMPHELKLDDIAIEGMGPCEIIKEGGTVKYYHNGVTKEFPVSFLTDNEDCCSEDVYKKLGDLGLFSQQAVWKEYCVSACTQVGPLFYCKDYHKITNPWPCSVTEFGSRDPVKGCCDYKDDKNVLFKNKYPELFGQYCESNGNECDPGIKLAACTATSEVTYIRDTSKIKGCVIDPSGSSNNNNLVDYSTAKNPYMDTTIMSGNDYCNVACKEDYIFDMPGYRANIKNGTWFNLNKNSGLGYVKLNATRTCVTSNIKIDKFIADLNAANAKIIDKYNFWIPLHEAKEHAEKIEHGSPGDYIEYSCSADSWCAEECWEPCGEDLKSQCGCGCNLEASCVASGPHRVGSYYYDSKWKWTTYTYATNNSPDKYGVYITGSVNDSDEALGTAAYASSGSCRGGCGGESAKNGIPNTAGEAAARQALRDAIKERDDIIDYYNNCSEWPNNQSVNPKLEYDYAEKVYMDDILRGLNEFKPKNPSDLNDKIVTNYFCKNITSDDRYENCRGTTWDAITSGVAGFPTKDKTIRRIACDVSHGDGCLDPTDKTYEFLNVKKESKVVDVEYRSEPQLWTEHQDGNVGVVPIPSSLADRANLIGHDFGLDGRVFPVPITKPAGVYNYTISFSNLGQYNNRVGQGRLDGVLAKAISENKYTGEPNTAGNGTYLCAYGVVEDMLINPDRDTCPDGSEIPPNGICPETSECVVDCDNDIDLLYCPDGSPLPPSGICPGTTCPDGSPLPPSGNPLDCECLGPFCFNEILPLINFFYRPVSLNDVFPNPRYVGTNWTNEKGQATLRAIEAAGNEAYKEPEYSYTLTPRQMQNIRDYNRDREATGKGYSDFRLRFAEDNTYNFRSEFLDGEVCNNCFTDNLNPDPRHRDVNFISYTPNSARSIGPAWK